MKVDLHLHSSASFDCQVPPELVAERCRRVGLSPIFLTDHETIEGALSLRDGGRRAVIGQEVLTTEGELIGLFLRQRISTGLTPEEAVARIKEQGGLVMIEHPYDRRRRALTEVAIDQLRDRIDIVEVVNGRALPEHNRKAAELRGILGVPAGAGSDAHTVAEIGSVYLEMEDFEDAQDFLTKLTSATIHQRRTKRLILPYGSRQRPGRRPCPHEG